VVDGDDGVIRHGTYPAPLKNQAAQHPDLRHVARLGLMYEQGGCLGQGDRTSMRNW
jgi:hypothetical protein